VTVFFILQWFTRGILSFFVRPGSAWLLHPMGHRLLDHIHCFFDDVPRILPLHPVESLQGSKGPGIAEHAKGPGGFFSHPCIVIPQGIDQRVHGPQVAEPAQRFCRIPPDPLVVIGEFFEKGFKGVGRGRSPVPGLVVGMWGRR
jgi:hypothetical protein